MSLFLLLAFASIGVQTPSESTPKILGLTLSSAPSITSLKFSSRADFDESLQKINYESTQLGEYYLVWDMDLHDRKKAAARVALWEKFGRGTVKPGSVVDLREAWDACAEMHGYLGKEFGLTLESSGGANAIASYVKTVVLVDPNGKRVECPIFPSVKASTPGFKPFDIYSDKAKSARASSNFGTPPAPSEPKVFSYGFGEDVVARYQALSKLSELLANEKRRELEQVALAQKKFMENLELSDPAAGSFPTEQEWAAIADHIQRTRKGEGDPRQWKVEEIRVTPTLRIKIPKSKDINGTLYVVPVIPLDRPGSA
jgi:hypothetical protein